MPEDLDGELSRSDMALVRQALRQDWPIPDRVKTRILQRLINYVDSEAGEPPPRKADDDDDDDAAPEGPSDRTVIAAARTIAAFCSLSLKQQALDLARAKQEGKKSGKPLAEVVREAQRIAEERIRERDSGRKPG